MSAARKLDDEDFVSKLDALPTLPTIVHELNTIINDPMSSTNEVETIMSKDPSMTIRVLKLANSAYYAIPGGVKTVERAIAYLGFSTLNQIILSASVINTVQIKNENFDAKSFWQHSLGVAMASELIAKKVGHKIPTDLFTCGLIHDLGKLALMVAAPEDFLKLCTYARERGQSIDEAEIELGYEPHTILGEFLAQRWNLPPVLQACIRWHHEKDPQARKKLTPETSICVDVVIFANLIIHAMKFGDSGHTKVLPVPKATLHRLGVGPESIPSISNEVAVKLRSVDAFLQIILDGK